jgi:hypothetical protein
MQQSWKNKQSKKPIKLAGSQQGSARRRGLAIPSSSQDTQQVPAPQQTPSQQERRALRQAPMVKLGRIEHNQKTEEYSLAVHTVTQFHTTRWAETGWSKNLEFELCNRVPIVWVYHRELTKFINRQLLAVKKKEKITKPPTMGAPTSIS